MKRAQFPVHFLWSQFHLISYSGTSKLVQLSSAHLERHKRTHRGGRGPLKCSICSKKYTRYDYLERHQVNCQNNKNKNNSATTEGEENNLNTNSFECSICSKSFDVLAHLNQHKLSHVEKNTYECSFCIRGFKRSANLKKHLWKKH